MAMPETRIRMLRKSQTRLDLTERFYFPLIFRSIQKVKALFKEKEYKKIIPACEQIINNDESPITDVRFARLIRATFFMFTKQPVSKMFKNILFQTKNYDSDLFLIFLVDEIV